MGPLTDFRRTDAWVIMRENVHKLRIEVADLKAAYRAQEERLKNMDEIIVALQERLNDLNTSKKDGGVVGSPTPIEEAYDMMAAGYGLG